jgi:hypothetical protein
VSFSTPDGDLGPVELIAPNGWTCERLSDTSFRIGCKDDIPGRNVLAATVEGQSAVFTILGPEEAKGFGAGINVEYCKGCWTRIEACMCDELAAKGK